MSFSSLVTYIADRCDSLPAVVALSGGVDSSLVAHAARSALGSRVRAVTLRSELTPVRDAARARAAAQAIGIAHDELSVSVLDAPHVRDNGPDRCYHCKHAIFEIMRGQYGECVLLDGTNADDDPARPGLRAVAEFGVVSPLNACELTKKDVRSLARDAGLPTWNTPSESCLATRLPGNMPLTREALQAVERMESYFHELGVKTLRARHDNLVATVEYLPEYAQIMEQNRDSFVALIKEIGLRSARFKEWSA